MASVSAVRWPGCSGSRASWAGRTRCAARAGPPRRRRRYGRAGPGVHHRRVRGLAVQVGDEQRRQGGQRRLHHHQLRQRRHRRVQQFGGRGRGPRARRHRRLDRLQRRSSNSASRVETSRRSPPTTCPRRSSCAWTPGAGAPALAAGELLIDTTTANSKHLSVGSVVPVKFAQTGSSTMRIGGIFKPNALLGSYLVGDAFFLSHFDNPLPVAVLLRTDRRYRAGRQAVDRAGSRPTRTSRSRPGPSSRSPSRPRSTSCSVWSTPCWPWPWSSPSSASSTR